MLTISDNFCLQEDEVKTYNFAVSTKEVLNLCSIAGHVFKMETDQGPISEAIISLLNVETRETITSKTCCRECLQKWHNKNKVKILSKEEFDYIVNLIMR